MVTTRDGSVTEPRSSDLLLATVQEAEAFGLDPKVLGLDPEVLDAGGFPAWVNKGCDDFPEWVNNGQKPVDFSNPTIDFGGGNSTADSLTRELPTPTSEMVSSQAELWQARWNLSVAERRYAESRATGRARTLGHNVMRLLGLREGRRLPTVTETRDELQRATKAYSEVSDRYNELLFRGAVEHKSREVPTSSKWGIMASVSASVGRRLDETEALKASRKRVRPHPAARWKSFREGVRPTVTATGNIINGVTGLGKSAANNLKEPLSAKSGKFRRLVGATAIGAMLLTTASEANSTVAPSSQGSAPISEEVSTSTTTQSAPEIVSGSGEVVASTDTNQSPENKVEPFHYQVQAGDGVTHMLRSHAESLGYDLTPVELKKVNDFLMHKFGVRVFDLHTRSSGAIIRGNNGQVYFNYIDSSSSLVATFNPKVQTKLGQVYELMLAARQP